MRIVWLRIILEHGPFLTVVLYEKDALDILRSWMAGELTKTRILGRMEHPPGGFPWAVETSGIRCMHLMIDLPLPPGQQGPGGPQAPAVLVPGPLGPGLVPGGPSYVSGR